MFLDHIWTSDSVLQNNREVSTFCSLTPYIEVTAEYPRFYREVNQAKYIQACYYSIVMWKSFFTYLWYLR